MITRLYVKIGDRQPHQVIADLEAVIKGTVIMYTLEGDLMGMKISHDEIENFEAVADVDDVTPEYDEWYEDDQGDEG